MEYGSATPEKVLILEPNELRFCGPLLRPTITVVKLKNPNNFDVMYKFKTTAPRIYRVRPNLGVVGSHADKTVRIVLMPLSFELKERLVHKFMVLTAPAPHDLGDLRKVWSELDEGKLRSEKFKSIIEMTQSLSPLSIELCSSGTSVEREQEHELAVSCACYTSPSEDNLHSGSHTPVNTPKIVQTKTPRQDNEVMIAELRAENEKLRDIRDVLRLENHQLATELERRRDGKGEIGTLVKGSMVVASAEVKPKSARSSSRSKKFMLFLATSMTMVIVCGVIGKFVFPEKVNLDAVQNFLKSLDY